MKKLKFLSVVAMAAGMFTLTSCLSGGGNTSQGYMYGFADNTKVSGVMVVTNDFGWVVASNAFNTQLTGGEYVRYFYNIDSDNQSSTKYTTATVSEIEKYPEYEANSFIIDTTVIMPKEMIIKQITAVADGAILLTANKHAFIAPIHPNIPKDMKVRYEMSYDGQAEPVMVDGKRVYELYIRAVKVADGTNTAQDFGFIGAYNLRYFLGRTEGIEKSAGNETVNMRFKFINEFNKDSTSWNWGHSDVFSYPIRKES